MRKPTKNEVIKIRNAKLEDFCDEWAEYFEPRAADDPLHNANVKAMKKELRIITEEVMYDFEAQIFLLKFKLSKQIKDKEKSCLTKFIERIKELWRILVMRKGLSLLTFGMMSYKCI